jgi:hypothetical protein
MTEQQENALREYLQESIVPLIEQVLVKKLGQAMSYAATELLQLKTEPVIDKSAAVRIATSLGWEPKRKPLTVEQIAKELYKFEAAGAWYQFARAIEATHGIKGEA